MATVAIPSAPPAPSLLARGRTPPTVLLLVLLM